MLPTSDSLSDIILKYGINSDRHAISLKKYGLKCPKFANFDLPLAAINLIWEIRDDVIFRQFSWTNIQSLMKFLICCETYHSWELDTADGKEYRQVCNRLIAEMESRSRWRKIVTKASLQLLFITRCSVLTRIYLKNLCDMSAVTNYLKYLQGTYLSVRAVDLGSDQEFRTKNFVQLRQLA